jgi:hypothetical protein
MSYYRRPCRRQLVRAGGTPDDPVERRDRNAQLVRLDPPRFGTALDDGDARRRVEAGRTLSGVVVTPEFCV